MMGGLYGVASNVSPLSYVEFREVMLKRGRYFVAIDAEFVALSTEESVVRSDGTKSVIKPADMHLARLSLVRGQEPDFLVPFTDDYVETKEPIVDYLTEYSGIVASDLDPAISQRRLVALKSVYRQLRLLIDAGAVFVGHGLKKDFRTINVVVPSHQVVDTVELFKMEGRRNISLKFLAWYILGMDVQTAMHDSIEDARTAMLLYEKYVALSKEGKLDQFMEQLYLEGRNLGWRAPHWQ
jgi:PAB-dependent poly(A)-specific ribonuclease subunit 2